MTESRKQDFDRKKKSFITKKDHERYQEKNDKYFFYQSKYTRFEKPRHRDRETINFNLLQFYMNQTFDECNFRLNFQPNAYFLFSTFSSILTLYNTYQSQLK